MTFEERNNLVGLLAGLLIIGIYVWRISGLHEAGAFDGPDGLMIWARATLWLIGLGVIFAIVGTILGAIINAIVSGEKNPGMLVDERDRLIKIWGMRVTMVVMSAGLIGGLFALAFGWSAFAVLNLILAGFSLGDMAGNFTKLGLYRLWL
jgi:hypothetical protein